MVQTPFFIYAFIIFLSLFPYVINGVDIPCIVDDDCPILFFPRYSMCIDGLCLLFFLY
ncbi:Nodule Cysteine-Rich (NCR) secreted peptide [Medicago truncatula]|uniref:Nodule Cysteine-Rich (NCR) secreted peptide n=2 Tax=Medicago truncatula TaxID=3880 RepID=A0A072TU94_MEDTR|nr:Nodule Cysteine-Rich (NCR) secreted peptide [Medicago truncatula]